MRAVIQRVSDARVVIEGNVKGRIGKGMVVLLGIQEGDTPEDTQWLAGKIVRLRIFDDAGGGMNLSLLETGGEILLISQFTLFASTKKGNRPSYSSAARPETAVPLYQEFIRQLAEQAGKPIQTGEFGARMQISLTNDGPVTILIDSRNRE
jgi:D-tyrosyl-tRNA(Tyr) deacylase